MGLIGSVPVLDLLVLEGVTKVDMSARVIEGVHFIGPTSKNGYDYVDEAFEDAEKRAIYDGLPILGNHPTKEQIKANKGRFFDVVGKSMPGAKHRPGSGMWGAIEAAPGPGGDLLLWTAKNLPKKIGISHEAFIRRPRKMSGRPRPATDYIETVEALAAVIGPATTGGFFEQDARRRSFFVVGSPTNSKTKPGASMEIKDLTLEQLQEARGDLVAKILADAKGDQETEAMKAKVAALEAEKKEREEKLLKLEAEESWRTLRARILESHKISEAQVDYLKGDLLANKDNADAVVESFLAVAGTQQAPGKSPKASERAPGQPATEQAKAGKGAIAMETEIGRKRCTEATLDKFRDEFKNGFQG